MCCFNGLIEDSAYERPSPNINCSKLRTELSLIIIMMLTFKAGLYRIWCGVNILGDSGVHTLGDTSAFVNPAGQLLFTRRGKTRMDGFGIVFEFYIAPL